MNKTTSSTKSRKSIKTQTPFLRLVEQVQRKPVYVDRPQEDLFNERGGEGTGCQSIISISNRELLRNYKSLKEKLLQKKIKIIEVDLGEEYLLEIKLKKKKRAKTPFEIACEIIEQNDFSYLKRPEADLFDYL